MPERIGILNGLFGRAEKYQRSRRRAISGLKCAAACEKGFLAHVGKDGDTLGRVKAEGGASARELNRRE